MQIARTWILCTAILSAGVFSLLPIETAHAQKVKGEGGTFDVTLESATVDSQTGEVTISGTATCLGAGDGNISVWVRQPVGRARGVDGYGYAPIHCDEDGEPYTISLFAYEGRFGSGRAVVTLDASVCTADWWYCDYAHIEQSVRLTKAPR